MEKEEFHIKLEIPEFVKILDEPIRKEVLEETEKKIRPDIEKEFYQIAKELIARKLEILESPEKKEVPMEKTKKCPECGKEIDIDAKFCRFCGAKVEGIL